MEEYKDPEIFRTDTNLGGRWQYRVIGFGTRDPKSLLANPRNYRIHPKAQQEAVEGSLDEVGWFDEITINIKTDTVVDGHLRASLALRYDQPLVPVKYVDLSLEEEDIILATKDTTTGMAGIDPDKYRDLLGEIDAKSEPLMNMFKSVLSQIGSRVAGDETADSAQAAGGNRATAALDQEPVKSGVGPVSEDELPDELDSEVVITIECTQADAREFQPTIRQWGRRKGVTVSFE